MNPTIPTGISPPIRMILAEDQPQYRPLIVQVESGPDRRMTSEWEPTAEELELLMLGGRVRVITLTFGEPFQPMLVQVVPAPCPTEEP